jgi:hypothetical protein
VKGDATSTITAADAALVFEFAGGVVAAITVHQRRQEEWDDFFG